MITEKNNSYNMGHTGYIIAVTVGKDSLHNTGDSKTIKGKDLKHKQGNEPEQYFTLHITTISSITRHSTDGSRQPINPNHIVVL